MVIMNPPATYQSSELRRHGETNGQVEVQKITVSRI
jgi:hypothetical protein